MNNDVKLYVEDDFEFLDAFEFTASVIAPVTELATLLIERIPVFNALVIGFVAVDAGGRGEKDVGGSEMPSNEAKLDDVNIIMKRKRIITYGAYCFNVYCHVL